MLLETLRTRHPDELAEAFRQREHRFRQLGRWALCLIYRLSDRTYARPAESPTGRCHSGLVAAPFCEPIAISRRMASKRWTYKKGLRK